MARATITIPTKGEPSTSQVEGAVVCFTIGGRRLRALIHNHGATLTHIASGMGISHDLNVIKIERMARISSATRTTDRQAAAIALDRIVDQVGVERFWAAIDAAPVIN